jgi:DNA-binding response OmpR family regulator
MRVLIVEDSVLLQRVLGTALRKSGYAVDVSGDGNEGLWMAQSNPYDVIVLDIMLPKQDGLSILATLRAAGQPTHVLLLTARDTVSDRVKGLQSGADDYLGKPFALEELLARVQALCRRAYGAKENAIVIGEMRIDTQARVLSIGRRPVELTPREYLLLEYLGRRRGVVVSRSEIEEHIYDGTGEFMSNVVDSAICSLRKKLLAMSETPYIHTRRRMGYILTEAPVAAAAP